MRAEAGQLSTDHLDIFHHIFAAAPIRHIHQMHQQSRALNVPQKLRAQTRALMRAFDQSRNIGDHKAHFAPCIAHGHHAQIRLQRSERIIRNLGARRRDARN